MSDSDAASTPLPPRFRARPDFSSLSVRDLLDARDTYHVHLTNMPHVVATAIGRYLIRRGDWYEKNPPGTRAPEGWKKPSGPRDLFNTVVTAWSWPCVLVFVDTWVDRAGWRRGDKHSEMEPDEFVPRSLYLSDGRVVPTCVVLLKKLDLRPPAPPPLRFPREFVGGGYPILTRVQGSSRFASVGCLVTDGHSTFALTNRHVTGDEGIPVYTVLGGHEKQVGVASPHVLGKRRFDEVYAPWPGGKVYVNLDVGLIKLDDLSEWTTQVFGLGPLGGPVDLNPDTISLDLIDRRARAFGAASGPLAGRICALFYRYQSMGGFEYVSDLLIAPEDDSRTHPGDSGTLWCLEQPGPTGRPPSLHPLALEWGGQLIEESGQPPKVRSFTLGTFVSTILRELQLDLVRDWNIGLPEYWGAMGHYTIAARACSFVEGSLRTLMEANLERISYPDPRLRPSTFKGLSKAEFVPLADVPDYVWKSPQGPARRTTENPSHFADMDKPIPSGPDAGRTLLELCEDPANVSTAVWAGYYDKVKDHSRGTLPFRVWQIYEEMVAAVKDQALDRYVAAAGALAHYVGDACQPLHISFLFNGDPDVLVDGKARGRGVHGAYEARMVNSHGAELLAGISDGLAEAERLPLFTSGRKAALATVELMRLTFSRLAPRDIIDAYVAEQDLWESFGEQTIATMVEGVRALTQVWQSAWVEGGGDAIDPASLTAVPQARLAELYGDPGFIPSLSLKDLGPVLGAGGSRGGVRRSSRPPPRPAAAKRPASGRHRRL